MNLLAIVMVSIFSLFAVTSSAAPLKPAPAKTTPVKPSAASKAATAAALSKYQRDRLEGFKNSAPADRYFGRMKLSYLGINNTLRDAAITSGPHTTDAAIVGKISFAEDALTDWEKHYPRDPQLARTYFLAIQSEKKIWIRPNQERAWTYMNRIVKVFPTTYFGKIVKKDMAVGFTQHYYADAVPCPTPAPVQTPEAVVATATPEPPRNSRVRATPTPTPTATPSPVPTPSPTAVPTPEVRTLAKGLTVQIEIPACVPPATPTPTPSAAIPSATPLPLPSSSSPVPGASPAAPRAPSAAPSASAATPAPAPSPAAAPRQPAATASPKPAASASARGR